MALQTYDSQDAVPEAQRASAIETKDGKFIVAEFEDVAGLKASNARLKKEKDALSARASVIGDRTPEEVAADLEFAAAMRQKELKDSGKYDELTKIQKQELAKKDKELADLKAAQQNDRAEQVATVAIAAMGGKVKKLLDPVLKHLKVERGPDGKWVEQVLDKEGNVRITDGQGTPMTLAQYLEELQADDDYGVDFAPSGAAGGGARNSGGAGSLVPKTIPVKKGDMIAYRAARAEAEKTGAQVVLV